MTNRLLFSLALLGVCGLVQAGNAWVAEPGKGYIQFGYSRKQANTSWNASGDAFDNSGRSEKHDFRYNYLSGEVGLFSKVSMTFLLTYLTGYEGNPEDLERNAGMSDSWFALKYQVKKGNLPLALSMTYRTPVFYDIQGPYTRDLYNSRGEFVGHSPEWRGVLKEDYTLGVHLGKSIAKSEGWACFDTGYTWRNGAPADEIPVNLEVAWPVGIQGLVLKGTAVGVFSLGNDSPRQPEDRFGSRADGSFTFNDAKMGRVGASFCYFPGKSDRWAIELGYNQWVWGRSARRYQEPYLSLFYKF